MENFDVALISPPSRMVNHYRPPVALLYIAGYLTRKGISVKLIDVPLKEQIRNKDFFKNIDGTLKGVYNKMLEQFKASGSKIVGISCYTPEYFEAINLARDIKKIDPSVIIVAGGIHPTFYAEEFFEEKGLIDFCVIGEGEVTFYELCRGLLAREKDLSRVKGIAYYDNNLGRIVRAPARELVNNLDEISFPDYRLVDMEYYANASPYAIRGLFLRSAYLLATRGCPSQCSFCVAKKLREFSGYGRVRSAQGLIGEIRGLKEDYAIDSFYFMDDLFTINKENVKRFCSLLKKERLSLIWGCSSKVTTLNEELLKFMADAGCVQIDFGVERGSDRALKSINKGQSRQAVIDIFRLCHKYKIRAFANMLVNLPGETEEDLADIVSLLDEISPEIVSINIFTPYPGTQIYDDSGAHFSKEEYADLSKDVCRLIREKPEKFKFCEHNVDLQEWSSRYSRRYNKIAPSIKFHLGSRYWRILLNSKNKLNYLKQFNLLLGEFINQKFG